MPDTTSLPDRVMQVHCLAFEYPSYGLASGDPTEQSLVAALDAVVSYLKQGCGFAPTDIVPLAVLLCCWLCCCATGCRYVLLVALLYH